MERKKTQVGYDKEGLPIGLQIMGRPWAEATVLALAAAVEVLSLSVSFYHLSVMVHQFR